MNPSKNPLNDLAALAGALREQDDFVLLGHVNPDGDTTGSCIGLALALRQMGKRAYIFLPGGIAKMFRDFSCSVEIMESPEMDSAERPFVPKCAFSVDVSDIDRLGEGRQIFESASFTCMLDHHETNPGFGTARYLDGEAASTGELAVDLIRELGVAMTPEMASWLYIAILTDSGQFAFKGTSAHSLAAAGACVDAGAEPDRIAKCLYRTRSEGRTRLLGRVLSTLQMNEEKTICWSKLTARDFAEAGALPEDNEGAVNYLVEIRGVEIGFLAEERAEGTKFSLRSWGKADVAEGIARPLGGGGHTLAAGVTLKMGMDEAVSVILERAERTLNECRQG